MKKLLSALAVCLPLVGTATAQVVVPTPQLTQEQAQRLMMRQMQMMASMFDYRRSKLDLDETVAAIAAAAEKRGWKREQIHDVQAAMKQAGVSDGKRMKVILICPNDFNDKLAKASQGKLPPHPCRFTVFEGRDGKTYVVKMNSALFAQGLTGDAGKLLGQIAADEEAILKGIAE